MLDVSLANPISDIIQGGVVGVAVLTLIVLYRILGMGTTLLQNHMLHITDCLSSINGQITAMNEGTNDKLDRLIAIASRSVDADVEAAHPGHKKEADP